METNRHHLLFPRRDYTANPLLNRVRTNPINIHEVEIPKHQRLHYVLMGKMAVMSDNLARELIEFHTDIPSDVRHSMDLRRDWFDAQLDHLADISVTRRGLIGREASYWAFNLNTQRSFIR